MSFFCLQDGLNGNCPDLYSGGLWFEYILERTLPSVIWLETDSDIT